MTLERFIFLNDQRGNRQKVLNIQPNFNQIIESTCSESTSTKDQTTSAKNKNFQPSLDENSNLLIPDDQRMGLRSRVVVYTDEKANSKKYNTQKYPQIAIVADRLKVQFRVLSFDSSCWCKKNW